ncbi:MAG: membrane lipoprotein lipid attachment site-containing protein, partial [Oscillospiraceae bacterium]|nr:membrane lipoprotein lipid attachment site-containing protein [Oscillospiraceae bacterium]
MKKLICLVLIFALMLTACSKWEIEIVDPTKPVEGESELIATENEKEEKPIVSENGKTQENNGIQENDEPSVYEYAIMKIYESEEISQKDFVELSESEKEELISALNAESWTDVPEDWEADEALSGP